MGFDRHVLISLTTVCVALTAKSLLRGSIQDVIKDELADDLMASIELNSPFSPEAGKGGFGFNRSPQPQVASAGAPPMLAILSGPSQRRKARGRAGMDMRPRATGKPGLGSSLDELVLRNPLAASSSRRSSDASHVGQPAGASAGPSDAIGRQYMAGMASKDTLHASSFTVASSVVASSVGGTDSRRASLAVSLADIGMGSGFHSADDIDSAAASNPNAGGDGAAGGGGGDGGSGAGATGASTAGGGGTLVPAKPSGDATKRARMDPMTRRARWRRSKSLSEKDVLEGSSGNLMGSARGDSFRGSDKVQLQSARALAQANAVIKRLRLLTAASDKEKTKPKPKALPGGVRPNSPTLFKGVEVKDWTSKEVNPKFGGLVTTPFGAALLLLRVHPADNDPRARFRRDKRRGRGPHMLGKLKHSKSSAQLETSGTKLKRTLNVIRQLRMGIVRVTVACVTRAGMRSLPDPPRGMTTIGTAVEVVTSRGTLSFDGVCGLGARCAVCVSALASNHGATPVVCVSVWL